jgi:phosphate/sulfate permease
MNKMIKKKNRNLIKNYNEQIDVIDEYFTKKHEYLEKKRILQKKNIALQNKLIDQKFALRTMRQKLKTFETAHDRIRNVKNSITSSFVSFSSSVNQIAEMIADINATDRLERTKRSVVILDSTIFIEDKAKFEHSLSTMQSKLKVNVD